MIKYTLDRNEGAKVEIDGTGSELMAETTYLIHEIYRMIHSDSPAAAEMYKNHLIDILQQPDSPVWKEDEIE